MCGLAGYVRAAGPAGRHRAYLDHAGRLLAHRGPDGSGVWQGAGAGLVHRRLAVIDLSEQAAQPMASPDGQLVLAYNGEVYNFRELRRELEALGAEFRSSSDTEVILLGWRQWGRAVLDRLDGMFALAMIDLRAGELTLARDRFGEKPLVWTRVGGGAAPGAVVFGSEMKALLAWPGFDPPVCHASLHRYLAFQYCGGTGTAFEGIHRVPPATALIFALSGGDGPRTWRYWTPPQPDPAQLERSDGDLAEELRGHLDQAVRSRMVSDVPVGAFLSGGVDSSAVVSRMTQVTGAAVETFSIGFAELDHDERPFARSIAARFGTMHRDEPLGPDCAAGLARIAWHYGEPFADPSALPMFALSRLARSRVTVALSGDGGDELLLGYRRYRDMAVLGAALGAAPASGPRGLSALVPQELAGWLHGVIPPGLAQVRPFGGIRRRLRARADGPLERYGGSLFAFEADDRHDSYGPALAPWLRLEPPRELAPWFLPGQALQASAARADLETYLPDDILAKVDIAAMSASLETRAPLLARGFAEFALRVPASRHMRGQELKRLFRTALRGTVPDEALDRPKMGFGVPLEHWLRGPMLGLARDLLLDGRFEARGLLAPGAAARLLEAHLAGRHHHTRLWTLIMLEQWFRVWVDGRADALAGPPGAGA
jgi:asparagine synthase (glutamine-hydrolysing)